MNINMKFYNNIIFSIQLVIKSVMTIFFITLNFYNDKVIDFLSTKETLKKN